MASETFKRRVRACLALTVPIVALGPSEAHRLPEAGDIVPAQSDPRAAVRAIALATHRTVVQNLWWAAGYNVVAIPLAAGVRAPWGMLLSPAVGAVRMSASTVVVAVHARRLSVE